MAPIAASSGAIAPLPLSAARARAATAITSTTRVSERRLAPPPARAPECSRSSEEAVAQAGVPAVDIAVDEIRGQRVLAVTLPREHEPAQMQSPLVPGREAPAEVRTELAAAGPAAERVVPLTGAHQRAGRDHRVDVQLRPFVHPGERRTHHPVEPEAGAVTIALAR